VRPGLTAHDLVHRLAIPTLLPAQRFGTAFAYRKHRHPQWTHCVSTTPTHDRYFPIGLVQGEEVEYWRGLVDPRESGRPSFIFLTWYDKMLFLMQLLRDKDSVGDNVWCDFQPHAPTQWNPRMRNGLVKVNTTSADSYFVPYSLLFFTPLFHPNTPISIQFPGHEKINEGGQGDQPHHMLHMIMLPEINKMNPKSTLDQFGLWLLLAALRRTPPHTQHPLALMRLRISQILTDHPNISIRDGATLELLRVAAGLQEPDSHDMHLYLLCCVTPLHTLSCLSSGLPHPVACSTLLSLPEAMHYIKDDACATRSLNVYLRSVLRLDIEHHPVQHTGAKAYILQGTTALVTQRFPQWWCVDMYVETSPLPSVLIVMATDVVFHPPPLYMFHLNTPVSPLCYSLLQREILHPQVKDVLTVLHQRFQKARVPTLSCFADDSDSDSDSDSE
jgi:hypothetical protein